MIITFLLWIYYFLEFFIMGTIFIKIIQITSNYNQIKLHPVFYVIFGMVFTGTIASIISIFMPLGLAANIIIWVICILYVFFDRSYLINTISNILTDNRDAPLYILIFSSFMVIIILIETAVYLPKNYDTALYHAQAIRWIETFPAVPGLGNLHFRFAYNSNWLVLNALQSFSFLGNGISYHVLNGFFLMLFLIYMLSGLKPLIENKLTVPAILKLFLLPIGIYMYLNGSSSPGTDTPAILLIWIVTTYFLEFDDKKENQFHFIVLSLFSIICYMVTIKLSSIPLLIIPFFLIIINLCKVKPILLIQTGLISLLILLPWIIRNYIISGYLIYPIALTGFFNPDWKMPKSILEYDTAGIRNWSYFKPEHMPILIYLKNWLLGMKIQYRALMLPISTAAFLSVLFLLVKFYKSRNKLVRLFETNIKFVIVFFTSLVGITFLFISAPDFRYGVGFFILPQVLLLTAVVHLIWKNKKEYQKITVFYLATCLFCTAGFELILYQNYFYRIKDPMMYIQEKPTIFIQRLIFPAGYQSNKQLPLKISRNSYTQFSDSKTFYLTSKQDWCWYDPFPTVPNVPYFVRLRGSSFKEGFYNSKLLE